MDANWVRGPDVFACRTRAQLVFHNREPKLGPAAESSRKWPILREGTWLHNAGANQKFSGMTWLFRDALRGHPDAGLVFIVWLKIPCEIVAQLLVF